MTTLITGNTYPVKEQIKALGGKWDAAAKGWRVPAHLADQARALVSGAKPSGKPAGKKCGCTGKYHSNWCSARYGIGGYYDRMEGMAD